MRILFLFTFFCFFSISHGQQTITGMVTDAETGGPLPFANIVTNTNQGTTTQANGSFSIIYKSNLKTITFSYVGYITKTITVKNNTFFYRISLEKNAQLLDEVTVYNQENPALRIIKKAIKNKVLNNPDKKLNSYTYKTYNKLVVTANADSINGSIDSIYQKKDATLKFIKIDSSNHQLKKQLSKTHLYITEKIASYQFQQNKGNLETVLATRMAGLKEPVYEILALQLQSLSFYKNTYSLFGTSYTNPISKKALKTYKYSILDTVNQQNRPAYSIYFSQKDNSIGLEGVLYIDTLSFAVQKVITQIKAVVTVSATQDFNYYKKEDIWFPSHKKIMLQKGENKESISFFDGKIKMKNTKEKDSSLVHSNHQDVSKLFHLTATEDYFDINFNPVLHLKKRALNTVVTDSAHNVSEYFWRKYRTDTLTIRDYQTYTYLDSIANKEKVEKKINTARKLLSGYIPTKYFDIDTRNFIKYNHYEGFRLGVGINTNSNLSPIYNINAYGVFGTKDKAFKYGVGASARLNKTTATQLGFTYSDDLVESGSTDFITDGRTFSLFEPRLFNIGLFHSHKAYTLFFEHDISAKLHTKLSIKHSENTPLYFYNFVHKDSTLNTFILNTATIAASWHPFSEYILTRHGKKTIKIGYPQITVQAEKNFKNIASSALDFSKILLRVEHQITPFNKKHTTHFLITLGRVLGNAPLTHLLHAYPNQPNKSSIMRRFSIAGRNGFETMYFDEFFSDRLASLQIKHTFPAFNIAPKIQPELTLISRYALGDYNHPEKHIGLPFNSLKHGYQESGLEINKIFKGFGLSALYRHGAYHLPNFDDNLSFKFTFYFSLGF